MTHGGRICANSNLIWVDSRICLIGQNGGGGHSGQRPLSRSNTWFWKDPLAIVTSNSCTTSQLASKLTRVGCGDITCQASLSSRDCWRHCWYLWLCQRIPLIHLSIGTAVKIRVPKIDKFFRYFFALFFFFFSRMSTNKKSICRKYFSFKLSLKAWKT